MNWLDVMEAKDPAYPAVDLYCPGACPSGTLLEECDGGMLCRECGEVYSWAQLAAAGADE